MYKQNRFEDRVVVVTGASSGIGRETAIAFAKEGAKTVLVSRSLDKLNKVAEQIDKTGGSSFVVPTDVSSREEVSSMARAVVNKFGRVDILFNNAGRTFVGPIDSPDFMEDTKQMMDTDFFGTVNTTSVILGIMKKSGKGHIINMSSIVGRKAFPKFGGYSAAMHAITAFTDALRQELHGTDINVSTIHPGLTQTSLFDNVSPEDMPPPFRRMTPLSAKAVADAVLNGVHHNHARIIVPFQPNFLLAADAISPTLGDAVVRLLPNKVISRVLGTYNGKTFQHTKAV